MPEFKKITSQSKAFEIQAGTSDEENTVLRVRNAAGTSVFEVDNTGAFPVGGSGGGGGGAAIQGETTLSSGTAVNATTVPLTSTEEPFVGQTICIGAGLTTCEVRRVTAVGVSSVTVGALKYAHSSGERVYVMMSDVVPIEFFGAQPDTASFDSGTAIMAAMIDIANGNNYGVVGKPGSRYYSSIPLCMADNAYLRNLRFLAKAPFSINPLLGTRGGEPDQFFATLAGQFVTVTGVNTTTNEITLSGAIGSAVGARAVFYARQGDTLPAPLETGRAYYVKTNPSGNIYTISVDQNGTAVDFTTAGSGTIYCFSEGLSRLRWHDVWFEGAEIQGLNGVMAIVQQPSEAYNLRIEAFPGPKGCLVTGGQQGSYFNPMIIDGQIGINFQGGQFIYIFGGNLEDCDILAKIDTVDANQQSGYGRDIEFYGIHLESPGIHSSQYQTVKGNVSVSAGTFTLSFAGETTGAINFNATAATIQTSLEALTAIVPGDVAVTDLAGGLPNGRVQIDFRGGQYGHKTLSGTSLVTVNSTGLTGGTYSMSYVNPNAAGIVDKLGAASAQINGGVWSSSATKPDGNDVDTYLYDAPNDNGGYLIQNMISMGQGGNAVRDIQRSITLPWADTTGVAERLTYFAVGGRHGGNVAKNWHLGGRSGKILSWDEYSGELRFNGAAALRYGDTGPLILSGTGSPEGAVTAPVGSVFLRTNGATDQTLYRKESGAGNTGWVAVANPSGSSAAYPRNFKTARYYVAPPDCHNDLTVTPTLNELIFVPFPVGEALTADRITIGVQTAQATSVVRLGIYSSTDGWPGARVLDAGTVDASTTGYKEITISQALDAGTLYWLAYCAQTAAGTLVLRAPGIGDGSVWVGGSSAAEDPRVCSYKESGVSGVLPATATPATGLTQVAVMKLRAS